MEEFAEKENGKDADSWLYSRVGFKKSVLFIFIAYIFIKAVKFNYWLTAGRRRQHRQP